MTLHFHPSEWFHHGHAVQAHPRQAIHSDTFWMVVIMVAAVVILAAIMVIFGPPEPVHSPYLPSFPF